MASDPGRDSARYYTRLSHLFVEDRLKWYELSQAFYDALRKSLRDAFTMLLDLYRMRNTH